MAVLNKGLANLSKFTQKGSDLSAIQNRNQVPEVPLPTRNIETYVIERERVSLYLGSNQTISTASTTDIDWDTERKDESNLHNNSSNAERITLRVPGWYQICGTISFALNATGFRSVFVYKNTTVIQRIDRSSTSGNKEETLLFNVQYDYDKDDYIKVAVRQTSGGDLNILAGSSLTNIHVHQLS